MVRFKNPRCVLVYALAPEGMRAADANRAFNEFVGDHSLPLVLFHDHFLGRPGGVAIFYVETREQQVALSDSAHLSGWDVEMRPLIFAHSPAAFDEQTAFTLRAYRGMDWETLQREQRPSYGNPRQEAETAAEEES